MTTQYTFHQAVAAIDRATLTGRPFPRSLHDNVTSDLHNNGERMLLLDWHTNADRSAWLDYFGACHQGATVYWADDWHGWNVVLTAHRDDSGAGAIEVMAPSPAPGTSPLGRHRAADLDLAPTVSAALTPDAPITRPCGQQTRHETHDSHTRHIGACSRWCGGWDAPTVQMATVPA